MLDHRSVLFVCFTVLTSTELAGVNIRLLFFHIVVVTICSLDPCQVLQNRAYTASLSLLAVLRPSCRGSSFACSSGGSACNHTALLSEAKVTEEIAAVSQQMWLMSAERPCMQLCEGRREGSEVPTRAGSWGLPGRPCADFNPKDV